MSAGLSSVAIGGIVGGVGSIVGGLIGSNGAQSAADTQAAASGAGIAEQQREFDTIRGLLKPYVDAGTGALGGYSTAQGNYAGALGQYAGALGQLNNLTGANGTQAQQSAIDALKSNPLYTNSMQLGQQAILANASATGGLRGGNTIASLGYLPGQILSNVMGTQIGNLGTSLNGISGLLGGYGNQVSQYGNLINVGENAAAGTGQAAQNTGNNITSLIGQQGAAQAGGTLGTTNAITGGLNSLTSALGTYLNSGAGSNAYNFSMPAIFNAGGAGLGGVSAGMF
ncbi:hypothetical protein [Burkholderia cepacia]|uniref:hypothetical protein n=1 Tax=Burkholderia cepacia TaxID=292 RepID=UPI001CF1248A|nr:hypothetical protein [Burkholderia cepacia]MCA8326131.1 hypothetical protein [Burkholderia cepacia]